MEKQGYVHFVLQTTSVGYIYVRVFIKYVVQFVRSIFVNTYTIEYRYYCTTVCTTVSVFIAYTHCKV